MQFGGAPLNGLQHHLPLRRLAPSRLVLPRCPLRLRPTRCPEWGCLEWGCLEGSDVCFEVGDNNGEWRRSNLSTYVGPRDDGTGESSRRVAAPAATGSTSSGQPARGLVR